jgi:single-stranded-DNA-specific exonuclease
MPSIAARRYDPAAVQALIAGGVSPVLARILAARGVLSQRQLTAHAAHLISPDALKNSSAAARYLADAIAQGKRMIIVADYDCDGATACAIGMRGLLSLGAQVDYLVPNRFEYGYGLTPEIVQLAARKAPQILITVDNGIASVEGVAEANRLGMEVVVTDHHLPGSVLPDARYIVNPNQQGCAFPSKHLAGVGVMFYVLLALRAELRARGRFSDRAEPNLGTLLDLVALGTVADVVRLDDNNRILVDQGLRRIRAGKASAGVRALYQVAGRDPSRASTYDLGFILGPRLNAAGRLADMSLGIQCLLSDDDAFALDIAKQLDALNRERKEIEVEMQESALRALETVQAAEGYSLSLYDASWHQGVIGLLASRLKDKFHRPVVAFARGADGELKGSGRAIRALHLRDALDLVDKRNPGLLLKFGGHAAAAGVTIQESAFALFRNEFEAVARVSLTAADLEQIIETDGTLSASEMSLLLARELAQLPWGQGFPEPAFEGSFQVQRQRVVGERHLKALLVHQGATVEALLFGQTDPLPDRVRAVYRLQVNEYQGSATLQLAVQHWEAN